MEKVEQRVKLAKRNPKNPMQNIEVIVKMLHAKKPLTRERESCCSNTVFESALIKKLRNFNLQNEQLIFCTTSCFGVIKTLASS